MIKERHFGADIEGCHYATVISHVRSTHITHTRVETVRKFIQDQHSWHPQAATIAKEVLRLVVSGAPSQVEANIKKNIDAQLYHQVMTWAISFS